MNRILMFVGLLALAPPISFAQAVQPATAPLPQSNAQSHTEMRVEPGISLRVELAKTIDSKKAKAGDPIVVKTMDELMSGNKVAAARGTKIFGHVVSATPHHGDSPSTLEIAFDKLSLSENGMPVKAVIQALTKPIETPQGGGYGGMEQPAGGAAPMGAPAGRMGGMQPPSASTPNNGGAGTNGMPAPGTAGTERIPLNAQGVIGISGVSLNSNAQGDSTITSQKHNVKLESGTQMVLRVVR